MGLSVLAIDPARTSDEAFAMLQFAKIFLKVQDSAVLKKIVKNHKLTSDIRSNSRKMLGKYP